MNYPAPTRCPNCGVKEATAVCRWCGCWKFGRLAVDAAMRAIIAGRFWMLAKRALLVLAAAATAGCAMPIAVGVWVQYEDVKKSWALQMNFDGKDKLFIVDRTAQP